jgi:hypothetical protein
MIPAMTDPLGKHWDQPKDIREAPIDGTHVLLTRQQFEGLSEYSATFPSGVYPGKCWKRHEPGPTLPGERRRVGLSRWFLMWYGESHDPKLCSINHREIRIGRVKEGVA